MGLLKSQLTTLSGGSTNSPVDPNLTLDLEFSSMTALPASVTLTRASIGTYFDSDGVLQTALAGAARFDHDPVTLEPLGLLIEQARTNALPYSLDCFTGWTGSLVPTINSTVSPDGTASATLFTATGANQNWFRSASIAADATYTFSAFVKRKTGVGVVQMQCAGAGYTAVPVTDIWTRVSVIAAVTAGSKNSVFQINTAGDEVWIWGAQLEAGAFVTSYIPSTSAAVPRSGDAVKMTGVNFSSWYNPLAGTIAASRIDRETTQNAAVAAVNDDTTANRLMTYRSNLKSVSGLVAVASTAYNIPATTAPSGNVNLTAMTFTAGRAALCQNGGTVTNSAPPTMPVVTQLEIGSSTGSSFMNGTLAFLRYWNVAKTDAELQEITNPAKY